MNNDWKDSFYYTQGERKGIFVLALLLFLLLLLPYFLARFQKVPTTDFSDFKAAIADFEQARTPPKNDLKQTVQGIKTFAFNPNTATKEDLLALGLQPEVVYRILNYRQKGGFFYKKKDLKKIYHLEDSTFARLVDYIQLPATKKTLPVATPKQVLLKPTQFDPNTIAIEALVEMGLPSKTAQQWDNYRQKGGLFYKKEDLEKLYALTTEQYQQLAPFVVIPPSSKKEATLRKPFTYQVNTASTPLEDVQIDINEATVEDWQRLKGIGPYYAKKIVRFRELLGGFSSIEQIGGIYEMPDSVFQKIFPHLQVSPVFRKIAINTASIEVLSAHPYIKNHQAKVIFHYRMNHGNYQRWEDLEKVKVLSAEQIEQIKPYLEF